MRTINCPVCNNSNSRSFTTVFNEEGETPVDVNDDCLVCDGTGYIEPQFFLEFTFDDLNLKNSYWFPLMIYTNDMNVAIIRRNEILIALNKIFRNVDAANPIPYHQLSHFHLIQAFGHRKAKKVRRLNIKINHQTENDIPFSAISPDSILTPHLIGGNSDYTYTYKKFPVWVIKESGDFIDLENILVVNFSKD